jgi:hypothetical protein
MSLILCSLCQNQMIQPPDSPPPSASSNNMYTDLTRNKGIEEPDPSRNIVCQTCQAADSLLQNTISGWFSRGAQDNSNQPRSDEWKSLCNTQNQTKNKAAKELFAEILRPLIPSQPSSTPPSSSSSTSITQPETPQTFPASSVSNHNIGNRKRAVPDSKEVPSNESPLLKKTKPSAKKPVSVFQVVALRKSTEKNDFTKGIRQLIDEHAEDGEDKKNQNLDLLRQKAQIYGQKQGMDIEDSKKTRNQDFILAMTCLHGISSSQFNTPCDKSRYYKEIRYLDLAQQKFGLELPNSNTYETELERDNLARRVISLRKSLNRRLCKIEKTLSNEEQDVVLSKKMKTTIKSLKDIQKNIESQIKIRTNTASRAVNNDK